MRRTPVKVILKAVKLKPDLGAAWALLERYKKYCPAIYATKNGWSVYLDTHHGKYELGDIYAEAKTIEKAIMSAILQLLEKKHAAAR